VNTFARHGCGVAHCPTSNMRLASGIAPVKEYLAAGVKVGLGVDGAASNDGSHMLAEARQAMLLARLKEGIMGFSLTQAPLPQAGERQGARELMSARAALRLATRGGAAVLGRSDIGSLEVGKCADFFAINLNRLDYAGALHDPVAAVVFCQPVRADYTAVGGKFVVREGRLVTADEQKLVERHNQAARRLLGGT
jgi:8-oxoguanine deaminase